MQETAAVNPHPDHAAPISGGTRQVSRAGWQGPHQLLPLLLTGASSQRLLLELRVGGGHVSIAGHHGGMATSNVGQLPRQLVTPGRQGSHLGP
jgi:hypothetical protein